MFRAVLTLIWGTWVNIISHSELERPVELGVVRLQKRQIESELKVRQNERVPSRFDTRLWLYGLHGRVQSGAFRFK